MQNHRYLTDNSKSMREVEACRDMLAFMSFNLEMNVVINRMYFEGSENKMIIRVHFTFRGTDWLLERNVVTDKWLIKHKDKALFTECSHNDIITGNFK